MSNSLLGLICFLANASGALRTHQKRSLDRDQKFKVIFAPFKSFSIIGEDLFCAAD